MKKKYFRKNNKLYIKFICNDKNFNNDYQTLRNINLNYLNYSSSFSNIKRKILNYYNLHLEIEIKKKLKIHRE